MLIATSWLISLARFWAWPSRAMRRPLRVCLLRKVVPRVVAQAPCHRDARHVRRGEWQQSRLGERYEVVFADALQNQEGRRRIATVGNKVRAT